MSFTTQELQQIRVLVTEQIRELEKDREATKYNISYHTKNKRDMRKSPFPSALALSSANGALKVYHNRLSLVNKKIAKLVDLQKSIKLEAQAIQIENRYAAAGQPLEFAAEPVALVEVHGAVVVNGYRFVCYMEQEAVVQMAELIEQEEKVEVEKVEEPMYRSVTAINAPSKRHDGYVDWSSMADLATIGTVFPTPVAANTSKNQLLADLAEASSLAEDIDRQAKTISDILTSSPAEVLADPTLKPSNPKDLIGSGKLPLHLWPTTASLMGCVGLLDGMLKYGRSNFRAIGIRASIYYDAAVRHLNAWFEGEECDPDSGLPHLAHALACLAIIVDAQAAGKFTDDRAVRGGYRALVNELTPHVARLKSLHASKSPKHYTIADEIAV